MTKSFGILAGFRGDVRGNVAMTFGLSCIPILLVTGAAIDYSRAATQWSNLQQATDATALSAAHTYLSATSTAAALKTFSQSYISGLMSGATVNNVVLSNINTQVCVYTTFTVPAVFMKIAGVQSMPVSTSACSQVGHTYEVALALDNSGSMLESAGGQSKIQALQAAAKQLVGILIPSGTTAPQVGISIVPFTSMVNVGPSTVAPFLDLAGSSSIHWQNFHRPSGTSFHPTTKFDLFNAMKNATWAGCVEERPVPYATSDTAAVASLPDTKFVPYLAPDEPGAVDNSSGYACYPTGNSNCGKSLPPYIYFNSYIGDNGSATTAGVCSSSSAYANADNAAVYSGDGQTNLYPGAGITEVCKYSGSTPTVVNSGVGIPSGPNLMCTAQKLTSLTTDTSVLNTAIDSMQANGSTNLATGFMWAWRTISPVVNPFPTMSVAAVGPQNPKPYSYGPPPNTKIIILMTDGFNSWTTNPYDPAFGSLYEAFGYYGNNRISSFSTSSLSGGQTCSATATSSSTFRCQMDNLTLEACNNAKTNKDATGAPAPVLIYTIGFSVTSDPIDAQGLSLLQHCASSTSNFFQASDSAGIQTAFQQIGASILSLRLSQ